MNVCLMECDGGIMFSEMFDVRVTVVYLHVEIDDYGTWQIVINSSKQHTSVIIRYEH